jgi:probable rRNA maturation factor
MPIEVELTNTQSHVEIDPKALEFLIQRTLERESRHEATIELLITDNATIHQINRTHLGHDWPTDVITFPLSDPDDVILSGELVISAEMAKSVAAELNSNPQTELSLYIIHGLLHLCGMDDTTPELEREIRLRESFHLLAENLTHLPSISSFP